MQKLNLKQNNPLCKQCGIRKRVTLYYCQPCREAHNVQTRELKRKYREEGKCVMCGVKSDKRRCSSCEEKNSKYIKDSLYVQSKNARTGRHNRIKEIMELV